MLAQRKTEIQDALESGGDYLAHAPEHVKEFFETVPHDQALILKKIFTYEPGIVRVHAKGQLLTFQIKPITVDDSNVKADEIEKHDDVFYFTLKNAIEHLGEKLELPEIKLLQELAEEMPAGDFDRVKEKSKAVAQLFAMLG